MQMKIYRMPLISAEGRWINIFPKSGNFLTNFDSKPSHICVFLGTTLINKYMKLIYKILNCQPWHSFFIQVERVMCSLRPKKFFGGRMALNSQKSGFGLKDPMTAFQSEVQDDRSEREFKTLPLLWFS